MPANSQSRRPVHLQGRYWLLTIPHHLFTPYLPDGVQWIKGQLETGSGGYLHWQIICAFPSKVRPGRLREVFGEVHHELSRSAAADSYVHKEDTSVPGTRFELGSKKLKRNSSADWLKIKDLAKEGSLDDIEPDIMIRHYSALTRIHKDYAVPIHRGEQEVFVLWGVTGSGKSHRAFEHAGDNCYIKSPLTKWWDGYHGQENVVVDEFRGQIDISHLLRWLDKYPCMVETKGSAIPLKTKKWWFTSNLDPRTWYPNADDETLKALRRRFTFICHYPTMFAPVTLS